MTLVLPEGKNIYMKKISRGSMSLDSCLLYVYSPCPLGSSAQPAEGIHWVSTWSSVACPCCPINCRVKASALGVHRNSGH